MPVSTVEAPPAVGHITLESALCHAKDEHAGLADSMSCYGGVHAARHLRSEIRSGRLKLSGLMLARTGTPGHSPTEVAAERAALLEMADLLAEATAEVTARLAELNT